MAVASTRASVINQTLFNTSDAETGLIVRGVVLSIDEEYARTHTHTASCAFGAFVLIAFICLELVSQSKSRQQSKVSFRVHSWPMCKSESWAYVQMQAIYSSNVWRLLAVGDGCSTDTEQLGLCNITGQVQDWSKSQGSRIASLEALANTHHQTLVPDFRVADRYRSTQGQKWHAGAGRNLCHQALWLFGQVGVGHIVLVVHVEQRLLTDSLPMHARRFYNGIVGLVPLSKMVTTESTALAPEDIQKLYTLHQPVKCQVLYCKPATKSLILSFKLQDTTNSYTLDEGIASPAGSVVIDLHKRLYHHSGSVEH
jgi:hypothetical protein